MRILLSVFINNKFSWKISSVAEPEATMLPTVIIASNHALSGSPPNSKEAMRNNEDMMFCKQSP